ncbi:DUF5682 family protein [Polyangium jinanense]|uniref:ChaN family lipoprotein n=1 Tax=Polyangium jinanense TaxID=2829994 RepID=A0A9X3X4Y2_9BACT|nr:DUF5682 family protein [Polyangium jinanense]MDC3957218.1 hypothetical protein [Polyangium jinanense]MDC3982620.1 hypothetical protein [Polyangium jinanense]
MKLGDLGAPEETRAEVAKRLGLSSALAFFPVRHQSPTCAAKLEAFLPAFAPDVILVELPARFEEHLEALLDPESHAPFAICAITEDKRPRFVGRRDGSHAAEAPRSRAYYPFCDYSPELVALRYAKASGAEVRFIDRFSPLPEDTSDLGEDDLPSAERALGERLGQDAGGLLGRSRFTAALCARAGARDFDELWEALFEQGGWDESPEGWALAVGVYALATRWTFGQEELEADGTLSRERFMAAKIAEAAAQKGKRALVVAGALHVIALGGARETLPALERAPKDDAEAEVRLVPYTFPRLDALLGYAPGMSGPAFYQHVWEARAKADPFAQAAERVLLETIRRARVEGDTLGPADAIAALAFARELASLRGRPKIGRAEVIEAATSCFVKGELRVSGRRVVAALGEALRGSRMGKLGPTAGPSPILRDFRATAEALGLLPSGGPPRGIELSLAASKKARRCSWFLHRTTWLGLGFATQVGAGDAEGFGAKGAPQASTEFEAATERWTVAYAPEVDARLLELAAEGASVEEAAARLLVRAAREGEGRAGAIAVCVGRGVRMGLDGVCLRLAPALEAAIRADDDPRSLLEAARKLRRVRALRARLGLPKAAWLDALGRAAYEEGTHRLPRLAQTSGARAADVPALLADLGGAALAADGMGPVRELLLAKARAAREIARAASPLVLGALDGLLVSLGEGRGSELGAHFEAARGRPEAKGAYLEGLLALSPRALLDEPSLLEALVAHVTSGSFEGFLASLPSLRRALARLGPRELEEISSRAAERLGLGASEALLVSPLPPEEVARLSAWELRWLEAEAAWAGPSSDADG